MPVNKHKILVALVFYISFVSSLLSSYLHYKDMRNSYFQTIFSESSGNESISYNKNVG